MGIMLNTDFKDFYDHGFVSKSDIVYNRKISESKDKGEAINLLREVGINTIQIKPVSKFSYNIDELVVYTNPKLHGGKGKKVMKLYDASQMYGNYLASEYIKGTEGITIKVLHIGARRYRLTFKNTSRDLKLGELIQIEKLSSAYNYDFMLPVFSIDYISDGMNTYAVDLNEVQNLEEIGMDKYITADEVIHEIYKSLIKYGKI